MCVNIGNEARDTLKELFNIGVGKASGVLNGMIDDHITLEVPQVEIVSAHSLQDEYFRLGDGAISVVHLPFSGPFGGESTLLIPHKSATRLVALLNGVEPDDAGGYELKMATLIEVGNILLNAVVGAFGNLLGIHLDYAVPTYQELTTSQLARDHETCDTPVLLVKTRFLARQPGIEGGITLIFDIASVNSLTAALKSVSGA